MFDSAVLLAFFAAATAIILAPGPAQALVISRSLSEGKRSGIMTAIGLNIGTIVHAAAAALGLSAILATSAVAFALIKYIGAAYLIYLGIKELRSHTPQLAAESNISTRQALNKAILTGILNPKIALFFLAFLPQFIDPQHGSVLLQFLMLGFLLAIMDIIYESFLAIAADVLSARLLGSERFALWRQRFTGVILIGLGIRLALTQRE
jgi:threonine/homoserine/homoserine lactone efflux protein